MPTGYDCGQLHMDMPKVFPILNLQYVKTEPSYDSDMIFSVWVGLHINSKLIQLFQAA